MSFKGLPAAQVRIGGQEGRRISLEWRRRAHVVLDVEDAWCEIQLHAPELYRFGAPALIEWIERVGRLFGVREVRMTGVEVNRDFTGVEFYPADASHFVGQAQPHTSLDRFNPERLQTIRLGQRSGTEQLSVYDKTAQLRAQGSATIDTYAPTWLASGWDGRSPVWRAEARMSGRALDIDDGQGFNFRKPEEWLRSDTRERAFSSVLQKHRLVVPTLSRNGTPLRRTRCPTDPRWVAICGMSRGTLRLRRPPRDAAECMARACRQAMRSLAIVAAHEGLSTPEAALEVARQDMGPEIWDEIRRGYAKELDAELERERRRQARFSLVTPEGTEPHR